MCYEWKFKSYEWKFKNRIHAVWKCKRAENKWANVGEQQSMSKIVRLIVKIPRT